MEQTLTTSAAARLLGVAAESVSSWVDEGQLKAGSAPQGHRQIAVPDLIDFLRTRELPIPSDLLGSSDEADGAERTPAGDVSGRDTMRRCPGNPLISLGDLPFRAGDIWNAGVAAVDGRILLLLTVEMLEGRYAIFRAMSDDGENFTIDREPFMVPMEVGAARAHESGGIRDPRITPLDNGYAVVYVADGDCGLRVGMAVTEDFRSVRRIGYLSQVDVKNGALFPQKINGKYALLKRPDAGGSIWLSASDDLVFWGSESVVMTPRGGYWDADRIGPAAPPIEIDEGWLLIYYGEKCTSAGPLVRLGAAVLDRDDP